MRKFTSMIVMALCATMSASAAEVSVVTNGDGTQWTLAKLAAIDTAGVTQDVDTFTLSRTVVIAKGDHFDLTGGVVVKLAKGISFEVEGTANFAVPAEKRVLFTRSAEGVVPGIVYFKSDEQVTTLKNVDFEYVGVKNFAEKGLVVDSCTFRRHAASTANGSSAINMGGDGAEYVVTNCIFERNERSGIGGAANSSNPITLENCQFLYNGTNNRNYPQVNLTAASQVVIRQCVVLGDRSFMRVGGIVVSNLMGTAKDAQLLVENCFVKDCSYGISVYSDQTAVVRNNVLIDNDRIASAAQGGSGLNVTDANGKQVTKFYGNFITGSLWGATIIGGKDINLGRVDVDESSDDYCVGQNVFFNNGNDGKTYDLYNNSANTVYAQNNFWLTAASFAPEAIDTCIFDKRDDASLGEVIYKNATATPVPTNIAAMHQTLMRAAAIYNLNGVRTEEMRKGLNIVVKDGKAVKVVK